MSRLGRMLKEIRVKQGRTQNQVAEQGQFGPSLIQRLESGRARYVRVMDICHLANGLDVTEAELWQAIPEANWDNKYIRLD